MKQSNGSFGEVLNDVTLEAATQSNLTANVLVLKLLQTALKATERENYIP
jgi:hypothetical protein